MEKHEGMKSRVLRSVHKLIYRHWVDPIQQRIPDLAAMKPCWRRRVLLKGASWGANAGRLVISDFRVHVRYLRGSRWSVVYIGGGFSFEELCQILFLDPPEIEELPRVFLWQVPALAKQFVSQCDLVVCELNQMIRWRPRGAYVFTVARSVNQVLDITRSMEDILAGMNQNMRRNLRKMEKQGFSYVFTQEQKDFDLFYYRMHRPYIGERHGARAVADYAFLRQRFKQGGLILVKRGQEPICGIVCRIVGHACNAEPMGVHEEHFDQVHKGASVALWWFAVDWARSKGLRRFNFGGSRGWAGNGTFNFKKQWGTQVVPEYDAHTEWVFYSADLPLHLRHRLNEQGLISEVGSLHYQVVLLGPEEKLTDAELAHERKSASRCGLDGILLISPQEDGKESFYIRQMVAEEAV